MYLCIPAHLRVDPDNDVYAVQGEGVFVPFSIMGDTGVVDAKDVADAEAERNGAPKKDVGVDLSKLPKVSLTGKALLRRAILACLYSSPRFRRVVSYHFRNAHKAGSLTFQEAFAIICYEFGNRLFFLKDFYDLLFSCKEVMVLVKVGNRWNVCRATNEFQGRRISRIRDKDLKGLLDMCKIIMLEEWRDEKKRADSLAPRGLAESGDEGEDSTGGVTEKKIIRSKEGNLGGNSYTHARKFKEFLFSYARLLTAEQLETWADEGFDFHQVMSPSWHDRHNEWREILEPKLAYHSLVILDEPKRQGHYRPSDFYMVGFGWQTWRAIFEKMDPRKVPELEAVLLRKKKADEAERTPDEEFDLDVESDEDDDA